MSSLRPDLLNRLLDGLGVHACHHRVGQKVEPPSPGDGHRLRVEEVESHGGQYRGYHHQPRVAAAARLGELAGHWVWHQWPRISQAFVRVLVMSLLQESRRAFREQTVSQEAGRSGSWDEDG